jgi:predicted MFS family arabinose efflux permease
MASVTLLPAMIGVLAPLITQDLGLSTFQLGTLTSAVFIVGALLSVPAGRLVDQLGGLRLLRLLFAAAVASLLAGAVSDGYAWLLTAAGLAGFPLAIANPATNELVSRHIASPSQGLAIGIKQSGIQAAPFLAGTALVWVSIAWGWRGAMVAGAVCPLLGALLTLRYVLPLRDNSSRGVPRPRIPWHGIGWLAAYAFLMGCATASIATYLPLFAHDQLGASLAVAGFASAVLGATGMVMRIVWGHLGGQLGRLPFLLMSISALATAFLVPIWLSARLWPELLWLGVIGIGATAGAWNALGMLAIIRQDDGGPTGAASGVVLLGFYTGFVIAPLVFGISVDVTGSFDVGWGIVALCLLLAMLVSLVRMLHERS